MLFGEIVPAPFGVITIFHTTVLLALVAFFGVPRLSVWMALTVEVPGVMAAMGKPSR